MSIAFNQTTHSLAKAQDKSWLSLALAILLLLLWLWWFVFGAIANVIAAQTVSVSAQAQPLWEMQGRRVVAYQQYAVDSVVDKEQIANIEMGQPVAITLRGSPTLPLLPLLATVDEIDLAQLRVRSYIVLSPDAPALDSEDISVNVEIELSSQSPAAWLFHLN